MEDEIRKILYKTFSLTALDPETFKSFKSGGVDYQVEWYQVKGIGNLCYVETRAKLGLIRSRTLVFQGLDRDMPLLKITWEKNGHNRFYTFEEINTMNRPDLFNKDAFQTAHFALHNCPDAPMKPHWYDSLYLVPPCHKSAGAKDDDQFLSALYLVVRSYLDLSKIMPTLSAVDIGKKKEVVRKVNDGLISGTNECFDKFKEALGEDKATLFYQKVYLGYRR